MGGGCTVMTNESLAEWHFSKLSQRAKDERYTQALVDGEFLNFARTVVDREFQEQKELLKKDSFEIYTTALYTTKSKAVSRTNEVYEMIRGRLPGCNLDLQTPYSRVERKVDGREYLEYFLRFKVKRIKRIEN